MEFPDSYSNFIWVVFGTLGTSGAILFSFYLWNWMKSGQTRFGSEPNSNWTMIGMCFVFSSGLMCCGIVGPPGYALSDNPELVSKPWIMRASMMSMVIGILGWSCVLIGQRRTIKKLKSLDK